MDTVFIPTEIDFKRWIKEALKELLGDLPQKESRPEGPNEEPLLSRKEIAFMFKVSLVTLFHWQKSGLPTYKQGGRIYFLHSEVMAYIKQKTGSYGKK